MMSVWLSNLVRGRATDHLKPNHRQLDWAASRWWTVLSTRDRDYKYANSVIHKFSRHQDFFPNIMTILAQRLLALISDYNAFEI